MTSTTFDRRRREPVHAEEDQSPRLLSIEDVADYLGVSSRWVYTQVRSGRLAAMLIARSWRIRQEAVDDFAESCRANRKPESR